MGKDYYALLGVPKDVDDDALKQAYKKQALKWHPDRNKDNEDVAKRKFQDISEAFEVLSDSQKRAIYDQFGEEGLKGGAPAGGSSGGGTGGFPGNSQGFPSGGFTSGGFPGGTTFSFSSTGPGGGSFRGFQPTDPNDVFRRFFEMGGMGGGMGGMGMGMGSMGGMGGMGMGGMGGDEGPGAFASMFGGRRGTASRSDGLSKTAVQKPLPVTLEELYKGATKRLKVTRRLRDSATGKSIATDKILTVNIKPGWKAGTKIRFQNEGDELPDGQMQDIEFVLEEKSHPVFKRDGDNLRTTIQLSLAEALTGYNKQVATLDGRQLNISHSTSVIQPGQESRISGEGMPNSKTGNKGDMIVKYEVKFPTSLSATQKEAIRKAIG